MKAELASRKRIAETRLVAHLSESSPTRRSVRRKAGTEADARKAEVLKMLGLKTAPGADVLETCAGHLEHLAGGHIGEAVQEMSRHLVEALCQAISSELSQPSVTSPSQLAKLARIAKMKVLLVRTLRPDSIRRQCELLQEHSELIWAQEAKLELGSFDGTAFSATQARSTVCFFYTTQEIIRVLVLRRRFTEAVSDEQSNCQQLAQLANKQHGVFSRCRSCCGACSLQPATMACSLTT